MRPSIPLLLVLGLLLGPAYYGYCVYLSGETVQTIPMSERADRWVLPDGSILRFHNSQGYRPVPLDLKPDMNLVALRLRFEFPEDTPRGAAPLQYQATLQQFDHAALERTLHVGARAGTDTADFGTVEIHFPGQYLFLLEEVAPPAKAPTLTLELRQKIETPNRYVVWTGLALLLLALVLQIHWMVTAGRRARPGS